MFLNWPNFHSKQSITNTVLYSVNSNYLKKIVEIILWLKTDSHLPNKICVIVFIESPLKIMENALFRLKSSFDSQDI